MTDEKKLEETKNCICTSKGFRKFLIVTFGSFFGVFFALSLYGALHKPPVPCPGMQPQPYHHECRCDRNRPHGDFHKKMKPPIDQKAPINVDKAVKK